MCRRPSSDHDVWLVSLLPILMAAAISCADTGHPPVSVDWKISEARVFTPEGEPVDSRIETLLQKLQSDAGDGEPVTREEFALLLARPEAAEVYSDRLLEYASPRSIETQEQEHRDYRHIFMKEERLRAGVRFWEEREELLAEAERRYGVPPRDIVAVLMWESGLGEFTGEYRVFNVFMGQLLYLDEARDLALRRMRVEGGTDTAATDAGTEQEAARLERIKDRAVENLAALIRQCRAAGMDPLAQRGSWGGAIGFVQFLPMRMEYAVDGDGDGAIDLHSWPDAIFSVANYLREFGGYDRTEAARRQAIYSYNHSDAYVDGVIAYAEAVAARRR